VHPPEAPIAVPLPFRAVPPARTRSRLRAGRSARLARLEQGNGSGDVGEPGRAGALEKGRERLNMSRRRTLWDIARQHSMGRDRDAADLTSLHALSDFYLSSVRCYTSMMASTVCIEDVSGSACHVADVRT
jgi:hypothetical protein